MDRENAPRPSDASHAELQGPTHALAACKNQMTHTGKVFLRKVVFAASRMRVARRTLSLLHARINRKSPGMLHHPLDAWLGVETSGFQPGPLLRSGRPMDREVTGYEPIQPSTMARVVKIVGSPQSYAFVDIGCGKGRALILASAFGFRRIVGVEMSPDLFAVAQENVGKLRGAHSDEPEIEVVHGDATEFRLPDGPLLVLLYNPFGALAMKVFRNRVEEAHGKQQRPIVIAYVNPAQANVLEGINGFRRIREERVSVEDGEKAFSRYNDFNVIFWVNETGNRTS